ncbi:glutamate racemase [Caldanaerobius polysaccharolyticus]|uniref:glutamate racemase n=1 Tax=Caldanaerobius polysaccharolyticus TaxID=44256 RepID=UPI00047ED8A8|nr:glutamate racemase [Caldanaerobius polysaccharolyticus]
MDLRPIGVFDSGVGGMTVVKELMDVLKEESLVYFGDTARVPYGSKSKQTVTKYSFQNTRFLLSQGVKAVVIACNTASATSLEDVRAQFDIPVFGVIEPGAVAAVNASRNKKVGIIGTERTILSGAYEKAIKALDPSIDIKSVACPLFVPLVEEGWADTEVAYMVAREYLKPLKESGVDTLVLGCTHYPLLMNTISKVMGDVTLVNPARETALMVKERLSEMGLCAQRQAVPEYRYFVSDNPEKFEEIGKNFLKRPVSGIKLVDIEQY